MHSSFDTYDHQFWLALDELVARSQVEIDRPRGSRHPRFPQIVYQVDYGYLEGTSSMDGGGIDVWKGSAKHDTVDAIICILDLMKRDSEIKLLIGCTQEGYWFDCWTEDGEIVSFDQEYEVLLDTHRSLMAKFVSTKPEFLQTDTVWQTELAPFEETLIIDGKLLALKSHVLPGPGDRKNPLEPRLLSKRLGNLLGGYGLGHLLPGLLR